ncbi:T-complex protein 1 subunit eta-like isoform X1 [Eurosta solidaginis]|uniref:T-complex protein 1 subunit eta-like isoform X1 n=1 Tax=Eurosta solidaginis TaxID=178769 RepID=UPI00353070A8
MTWLYMSKRESKKQQSGLLEKCSATAMSSNVQEYQKIVDAEWRLLYNKLDRDMFCAVHVLEEDWKRRMKACGGAVMTTANDINSSVLGQCDYFEERQVGGERFNIFQGCVNARTYTLILRGGAEQFLEETELRYMML